MTARLRRQIVPTCAAALLTLAACGSGDQAAPTVSVAPSSSSSPASSSALSTTPPPSTTTRASVAVTRTTKPPSPTTTKPRPAATDVLTGLKVSSGPMIAVKIDNTKAGLPHFGVSHADIVYVEQVEGGLTRLIVLFRSKLPDEVGPVRSVRSTDAELLSMYGSPGLAFSGGAGGPLERLAATKIVDLSPDAAGDAYWRSDKASGTYNMHVNLAKLAADSTQVTAPKTPGFQFAARDPRLAAAKAASRINVTMISGETGFSWTDGRYVVSRKGEPYADYDGAKVLADNVLVQNVVDEPDGTVDSVGSPSYLSHTVGSGTFTLFRSGKQIAGSWKRAAADQPTSYLDKSGKAVFFAPGRTWVVLAPQSASVTTA
ncbi:DUF3048 domain-containing protein [Nakamurella sp. A5-74]|uniref:DUF3048 domain-containing protein n=1 Tax=Nakamurella sp. A5-74 TaxID=3158264 RepID=A0AAU8DJE5_9ACTN